MPTIFTLAGKNVFIDLIAIFFAKYVVYLFIILFLVTIFVRRNRYLFLRNILFTGLSLLLSFGIFEGILAFLFPLKRPFLEYGFEPLLAPAPTASFPSSHATVLFTLVAVLFLLGQKKQSVIFFFVALAIVLARVFAGLHYPIDILVGLAIGFLGAFVARLFMPAFSKRKNLSSDGE